MGTIRQWPLGAVRAGQGSGAPGTARKGRAGPGRDGKVAQGRAGLIDDAALAAISTTVAFHERVGAARIEARVTELATRLKEGLLDAGYALLTPEAPALSAGVCVAAVERNRGALVNALYEEHGIAGAATGGLRLCPHFYNTVAHIARPVRGARVLRSAA